jgi:hypothetical protein
MENHVYYKSYKQLGINVLKMWHNIGGVLIPGIPEMLKDILNMTFYLLAFEAPFISNSFRI